MAPEYKPELKISFELLCPVTYSLSNSNKLARLACSARLAGTITQSIDHSFYGEPCTAPDNQRSYYPNWDDHNTLTSPLVINPPP
jgi:hypothetical protein